MSPAGTIRACRRSPACAAAACRRRRSAISSAHRRGARQQRGRCRDARAFDPRGPEQDRAAPHGGAAAAEGGDRELSGGQTRARGGQHPDDPAAGTRRCASAASSSSSATTSWRTRRRSSSACRRARRCGLRYAYFITCREVVKDASGRGVELRCTYDPGDARRQRPPDGRKVKATLHWVSAADAVPAEVRLYNPLFPATIPGSGRGAARASHHSRRAAQPFHSRDVARRGRGRTQGRRRSCVWISLRSLWLHGALHDGTIVAVARLREAIADDCRQASLIVARFEIPAACRAAVIDRRTMATTGAIALRRVDREMDRAARALARGRQVLVRTGECRGTSGTLAARQPFGRCDRERLERQRRLVVAG
jgi:hypothetical protein